MKTIWHILGFLLIVAGVIVAEWEPISFLDNCCSLIKSIWPGLRYFSAIVVGLGFSLYVGHILVGKFTTEFTNKLLKAELINAPKSDKGNGESSKKDKRPPDLGLNWIVGLVERLFVMSMVIASFLLLIGAYLALKVLVNWQVWPGSPHKGDKEYGGYYFYKFLTGTLLSILYAIAGGAYILAYFSLGESVLCTQQVVGAMIVLVLLTCFFSVKVSGHKFPSN